MKQLIFYTGLVPPGLFLDRVRTQSHTAIHTHTPFPYLPTKEAARADALRTICLTTEHERAVDAQTRLRGLRYGCAL